MKTTLIEDELEGSTSSPEDDGNDETLVVTAASAVWTTRRTSSEAGAHAYVYKHTYAALASTPDYGRETDTVLVQPERSKGREKECGTNVARRSTRDSASQPGQ